MSEFEEFICKSEPDVPRTITYGKWSIVSVGEDGDRHVCVKRDGETRLYMWVDTHVNKEACFIHSVDTTIFDVRYWLCHTCSYRDSTGWHFKSWENVDEVMQKLVDYIRHAR